MVPVWARAAIRLTAPRSRHEDLLGDLEEVHAERLLSTGPWRAHWLTTLDAFALAWALLVEQITERTDMGNWLTWLDIKLALRLIRNVRCSILRPSWP